MNRRPKCMQMPKASFHKSDGNKSESIWAGWTERIRLGALGKHLKNILHRVVALFVHLSGTYVISTTYIKPTKNDSNKKLQSSLVPLCIRDIIWCMCAYVLITYLVCCFPHNEQMGLHRQPRHAIDCQYNRKRPL